MFFYPPIPRKLYVRCPLGKMEVMISLVVTDRFEYLTHIWCAYRKKIELRCESARNVSDDIYNGDKMDSTDTESSNRGFSSSDLDSQAEESGYASMHEVVLMPSNKPDKRELVDINIFHQTYARANARCLPRPLSILE